MFKANQYPLNDSNFFHIINHAPVYLNLINVIICIQTKIFIFNLNFLNEAELKI